MEVKPDRKVYTFKLNRNSRQRSSLTTIVNQGTLIGSYLDLRMGEKILAAFSRIKGSSGEKTVPICFKVKSELIPTSLKSLNIALESLVNVTIPECKPFPAMVIAIAGKFFFLLS